MNAKTILTTLFGIAVLALPAAVPASQPADIRLGTLAAEVTAVPETTHLAILLADPHAAPELSIVLPESHDLMNWIDQDPFAF